MKKIVNIVALIFFTGIVNAEPVVDIPKIAGKTENEVSAYLGKPVSCDNTKYGRKCQYHMGETEIVYIQGKADWITVEGIDSVAFSKDALTALGLKDMSPSFHNDFTLRWESTQGLREISLFKGSSLSDYAYIKVKTK